MEQASVTGINVKQMKKPSILFLICVCVFSTLVVGNAFGQVVPKPVSMQELSGCHSVKSLVGVYTDLRGDERATLEEYLEATQSSFRLTTKKGKAELLLLKNGNQTSAEAYNLKITPARIVVSASGDAGIFYGLQTLLQLMESANGAIPCVEIKDTPRFGYRGMMLDVSRHFFKKEFVYRQIDMLARYKLNVLQLHLHDTGGWRIELESHPELTKYTAFRKVSDWGKWVEERYPFCLQTDSGAYGGYYTREDINDILHYAAVRHIQVVPEIDLPGHSSDVLHACPQLACDSVNWKRSHELCIGREETLQFTTDVLGEIMELFPSKYIHIGGDECSTRNWSKCLACRKKMQEEHIDSVNKLQPYYTSRLQKYAASCGRQIIGWDEILDGNLSKDAVIMSWRPQSGSAQKALQDGFKVIMAPSHNTYFDSYQAPRSTQPKAMERDVPLTKAYNWDPAPDSLSNAGNVLGVQCCLWTEFIETEAHAEYMLYPRLMALAEVAWTPQDTRQYEDFLQRAKGQEQVLKSLDYKFFNLEKANGK